MTTETKDQTHEQKVQAQIARMEAILPRVIDTLIDIFEGRKFIAVVTTKTPDGEFVSMLQLSDNSDAAPPTLAYNPDNPPPASVFYQGATQPR